MKMEMKILKMKLKVQLASLFNNLGTEKIIRLLP
jgi:hypothetical protein